MDLEKRDFAIEELRVSADAQSIEGYAAVFNSRSVNLGGFVERILPGAFTRSIADGKQIFAYWNHDSNYVIGSTRGGKLALAEDSKGLHFRLNPARLSNMQIDAIRDGDMQMSFGFHVPAGGDDWDFSQDIALRSLLDVNLHEISPVSSPAYPDTSAALRSLDAARGKVVSKHPMIPADYYFKRKAAMENRFRRI